MHLLDLPHLVAESLPDPQAGGGGSFGGGGGGGGGGDGDGIVYLVYWLVRFAIEYPPVGVPLLIVVVVVAVLGSRKGWGKHQERTIRRARPFRRAQASATLADVLRARDADFDEQRFLARVEKAFRKAQESWCAQDLEPLRPFVSDGVFERFSLQVEEQREDGWRQGMDGLTCGPLSIVHVNAGAQFDTVTVRIPFQSDIHRLDLETGKRIRGSKIPRDWFTECWSFVRRRGTKTLAGEGLIEGKCPNCGAPLTMNQSARCSFCECLARSGRFDWVLAEITQASEWRTVDEREIPGLAAYCERDPGMSVQMLEDRASVAFWRKCAAERAGKIDPLTRVADEELCERYAALIAPPAKGPRTYSAECAVGSVRTLGILAAPDTRAGRDRAVVQVVWDGLLAVVDPGGKRRLEEPRVIRHTLYVFGRRAGQETRLDDAFTTAHCPSCGAHDLGGTAPACPYCGVPRRGDASTWLLAEIAERHSAEGRALLAELEGLERAPAAAVSGPAAAALVPSGRSAADLVGWAVALVEADGRVDERERRAVHVLAARGDVPPERVDELLEAPANDEAVGQPRDAAEARAWFGTLAELSLADGSLSRGERRFLRRAGELLGLGHREVEQELRRKRAALYRKSRAARRFVRQR